MSYKILVADDENDMELLISQRFRKEIRDKHFEFYFAQNGEVALQKLNENPDINLLLADINMPVMDGLTLIEKSKAIERPIKSVVISAYGDMQNIRHAMNRGAFDFLTKPVDFNDLEITIKKANDELDFIVRSLQLSNLLEDEKHEREKAEHNEKVKQQFLANMSHEIRTPLNAIIGMTRLLQHEKNDPTSLQYLNGISKSGETLLSLVNDILDLSKIEAGKMDLQSIPYNLRERLDLVYNMLKYKAEEKGLLFSVKVNPDVAQIIVGDPHRLNQILVNLAGNSIKFTNQGSVNILCELVQIDSKPNLQFSVSDTGIGMTKEQTEKIFESFTQADLSISEKYGGTGLGLNISKQLVELQGGQLKVNSENGKGSTFIFNLPYQIPDNKVEVRDSFEKSNVKSYNDPLNILLVEDNAFNQIVAVGVLKMLAPKSKVDIAENGLKALDLIGNNLYDIILMDVRMPEMDGIEATKEIRKQNINTPVIFMTAGIMEDEKKKCEAAGGDDFISKPFNPEELLGKIISLVR